MNLLLAALLASLAGSLHCAGMCGAFVAFAVGGRGPRVWPQVAYHGGRLITYAALGALAGVLGRSVDLGGSAIGFQRTAAIAAGALMIAMGLIALLRLAGVRISKLAVPAFLQNTVLAGHRASVHLPPMARALVIGLLTTLLPCGWLWMFVIWAAGTGSPLTGGLLMAAFWLGTVPVLALLGMGVQRLGPRLLARLPALTALLLLAMGSWTLYTRGRMPAAHAAVGATTVESVRQAEHTQAPCCQNRAQNRTATVRERHDSATPVQDPLAPAQRLDGTGAHEPTPATRSLPDGRGSVQEARP